ncbi:DEAD/DEAH box helicase [Janthinobacterium tructae]|uniref:DEAD/DEAH box helicase n=1 Tax=Janthinobacterium tructae TaxID=2590869 RepID=UPI00249A42AE|nr:SNF2-related protein [Janthinobacterium tructae]MDI3294395.1 SNF2-related protein [Janthinobacterium tructae]
MDELLRASAGLISNWLQAKLPSLGPEWWDKNVVSRLTFQQQRLVEANRIVALSGLDLAAITRVLDQNWSELAAVASLPREGRTWVKELQNIRNRWAHAPVGGVNATDAFRDADTVERLLTAMEAGGDLIQRLAQFKASALLEMAPKCSAEEGGIAGTSSGIVANSAVAVPAAKFAFKFSVGELVSLRSNSTIIFPVLEILASAVAETRYRVFENGTRQLYYESQLQRIEATSDRHKLLSAVELSALLTAVQLSSPTASSLYSFNSGRVRFVPYQYRPVLKLIRADRPRLLIADEVGVGKTIESGLILKELQARNEIKSVLIICPKALVSERKWELEMKRFDEHFVPLNGQLLRHCIRETHLGGEWPIQYEKVILPTSLFDDELLNGQSVRGRAKEPGLLNLDPPPKFDLVIVDEAHHIKNSETYVHQAVKYFAENAEAVVFLSATPVQLGREDLFTLLNVLRPDVILDQASFSQMAEPNQFINEAINACRRGDASWAEEVREQLRTVASTAWGREVLAVNPGFQHIYDGLAEGGGADLSRIKTIHSLESLYTFSSLINRTRRRDIGEFTTRKAETILTEFTPSQKALHDDLLSVIARMLAKLHGGQNVKFMMSTISRQASSSLYGLAPALQDILGGKLAQLEGDEDFEEAEHPSDFLEQIRGDVESLIERAANLDPADAKADAFLKVVDDKLVMPRNKVLVFSTFRHTLKYLAGKLKTAEVRFGLVHGGVSDDDRATLRRRFSLPRDDVDAIDILLSSEVGCEGLDFQFCDCLLNYDLPWNPMRIEQRIGRIDRYGQKSETVGIFNLVTPGTIDAEIYERCLMRIGVFQRAIGGNEEILGSITKELHNIAETFSLNEQEVGRRLQQLADNKIRQIEEEQRLEARQGELFGLNITAASWEEKLEETRNFWLEPQALSVAVTSYLVRRLGKDHEFLLGDKPVKTLRLSQEARVTLLDDFRKLPRSNDSQYRVWEKWLKGASPTLPVTFEQEAAMDDIDALLLSLGHPLVRQAASYLVEGEPVTVKLSVTHDIFPTGVHPFALYRWNRQGAKQDEAIVPICDVTLGESLLELISSATDAPELELPSSTVWDELDSVHHQRWLAESTQHSEDNRQLVGLRIQSLTASFGAKRQHLETRLQSATNEKIQVMKRSELERAQVDFDSRIKALRKAADAGDIRATTCVLGVLEVRRPS